MFMWVCVSNYHSVIGMARAESWKGPYTIDPAPLFPQFVEDPFLWYQPETDSYHALFHTQGAVLTQAAMRTPRTATIGT